MSELEKPGPDGHPPTPPSAPSLTPAAQAERTAREQREAQALRENLLRRKAHRRALSPDKPGVP